MLSIITHWNSREFCLVSCWRVLPELDGIWIHLGYHDCDLDKSTLFAKSCSFIQWWFIIRPGLISIRWIWNWIFAAIRLTDPQTPSHLNSIRPFVVFTPEERPCIFWRLNSSDDPPHYLETCAVSYLHWLILGNLGWKPMVWLAEE